MKKFISLFLAVVICVSMFASVMVANADETKTFADISEHWAKEDILYMTSKGLAKGVSDTEFEPERTVTRAEFLSLVLRIMGEAEVPYADAYADVDKDSWYANAVQTAKNLGVIDVSMTPDGKFNPDADITREEMTSFVVRAYELKNEENISPADISIFDDSGKISEWAGEYVKKACALSFVKGIDDKTFAPKGFATRAQAVTIARRLYKTTGKAIKILALGNSFSLDSMEYLHGMLEECGYTDVVLGVLYVGSCSLEKHVENILENAPPYIYYKNTSGSWVTAKEKSVDYGVKDEEWDIFVLQQSSGESGLSDTYEPHITELIKYAKENCPDKDVRLAWNITWAYQKDSAHKSFPKYNSDQLFMYNSIIGAFKDKVSPHTEIEYVFPVGTAVQNARTSYIGDTLTRDGHHLNRDIGRYIASLTWLGVLTDVNIGDFTYIPEGRNITESQREVAKEAVINAIANYDVITQSEFVSEPVSQ